MMVGSRNSILKGRPKATLSLTLKGSFAPSEGLLYLSSPVILRRWLAFHLSRTGAYVSGWKSTSTAREAPDKIKVIHSVHLQVSELESAINPPMKGPMTGPRNPTAVIYGQYKIP